MKRRSVRRISLYLIVGLIILGCAAPVLITPPPPSTLAADSLETIVVQTGIAAQTQTAVVLPPTRTKTATPLPTRTTTITPTPTATFLFLYPTQTSLPEGFFADDEEDDEDGEDGYQKPVVVREWDCRVISRSPAKGAVISRGSNFNAIWNVENTGTKTWPKKGVDVVFYTGARIHEKAYYDIPATVGKGGKVTVVVPLTAPKRKDTFSTTWVLQVGKEAFCPMRIKFETE